MPARARSTCWFPTPTTETSPAASPEAPPSRPPPATPPATCSPPSTPSIAWANPKTQAKVGRTVDLAVDTGGFHFFDKTTGLAIGHPDTTTKGSRSTAARTV
jgi:hypothetical protein